MRGGMDVPIFLYTSGRPIELFNWLREYISSLASTSNASSAPSILSSPPDDLS